MKKTFLFCILSFSILCFGQTSLESSCFGSSLVTTSYRYAVEGNFYPNYSFDQTGTNLIWDFSAQSIGSPKSYIESVPVSTIAGSENFPNSTYAETEFVISTGTFTYKLYKVTPTSYSQIAEKIGTGAFEPMNSFLAGNALPLPFNYGETFSFPTTSINSVTYSGFGTFISAFGAIENVIKLRQVIVGNYSSGPGYWVEYFISTNPCKLIGKLVKPATYNGNMTIYSYTPSLEISRNKIQSFSIYPNPTADFLTIKTVDLVEKGAIIRIYDFLGNLLLSNSLDSDLKRISIENFSSGIYIINITDKNNKTLYTDKIIKR